MAAAEVVAPSLAGLPASWRLALRVCPYCTGEGCARCDGTGDLFGALLAAAYRRGREDALVQMRQVYVVARLAGEQVRDAPVPELKGWLGL